MEKQTLYVAFSTQKGGVGKTAFTVLSASYLHYVKGKNVAVVDCDFPQHSINAMRKRDAEQIGTDEFYKRMAYEQFKALNKKTYPILCSKPEHAVQTADDYLQTVDDKPDVIFFDLPGTVGNAGVLKSIANMDYIFTPIIADRIVLESCLSFADAVHKNLVGKNDIRLKSLSLFWNKVDGREKTDLYERFEKAIDELDLPLMKTFIPDTKKYNKEMSDKRTVFRSTLFPADKRLIKGSNLEELIEEILETIKL
ncbi:MAG: ParA family protein [Tannerellaceae bacterium]|jgi:cellulose biosynthesis protein BcsQ|nr:ParA family protein [Tannerellaceae bacterium]